MMTVATAERTTAPVLQTVPVTELQAHPDNVREDLKLTPEWVASIKSGIEVPLKVVRHDDGALQVVMGHRRLAGAIEAGLAEVPCMVVDAATQVRGQAYVDMFKENVHREGLTASEQARALFSAREEGMSRTEIGRRAGLDRAQVKHALRAGSLSTEARAKVVHRPGFELEHLALLAEFEEEFADRPEAVAKLLEKVNWLSPDRLAHQANVIREEYREQEEAARVREDLTAHGISITPELPKDAVLLSDLRDGEEPLTEEAHAECEGRGAFFRGWSITHPMHYCADPGRYGHRRRYGSSTSSLTVQPAIDPALVRRGNREWKAAATTRATWLKTYLQRKKAPAELARWVATQVVTMPEPLSRKLGSAQHLGTYTELTGYTAQSGTKACATATAVRLPLLIFGVIATAYESQIAGEGDRVNTWRTDRGGSCSRSDAGQWLTFIISQGYDASPIERAVADGVPYTGADPDAPGDEQQEQKTAEPIRQAA